MTKKRFPTDSFGDSLVSNNALYTFFYRKCVDLATTMFKWVNLPDTIDERFLEMTLFSRGSAVFFEDEVVGYLALPVAAGGKLNFYNIPTRRRAFAVNGYQRDLTEADSVIIFNNYLHTNTDFDARLYAQMLYDVSTSIQINARAQKTPALIRCNNSQRLTLLNAYKEYDGNAPVIYADKSLNPDDLSYLNTGAPYVADKLQALKESIWNEYLMYLGIPTAGFEKKERLLDKEVENAQGGVNACRYSRLEMRKQACRSINTKFGLNIDVVPRFEDKSEMEEVTNE